MTSQFQPGARVELHYKERVLMGLGHGGWHIPGQTHSVEQEMTQEGVVVLEVPDGLLVAVGRAVEFWPAGADVRAVEPESEESV